MGLAQSVSRPKRILISATVSNVLAVMPVFLLGALAVLVRGDLGFREWQLGAAVSVFSAVSAMSSALVGRLAEQLGAHRSMSVAAAGSGVALLGIAALTPTYYHLVGWLALAGAANALAQPGANLALARGVDPRRLGLAFGIKQSAIPVATLVAGLAVPAVGLTLGWRWAFGGAAVGAVLFGLTAARPDAMGKVKRKPRPVVESPKAALWMLAAGGACASAAASSLAAFYVESAVTRGVGVGAAGLLFAVGSAAGIVARVSWGWVADRRQRGHFATVAVLLVCGAVGFGLLAQARGTAALAAATVLSFAAGWGWNGLFNFAVVNQNRAAPAAATGITQTGAYTGAVVGPLGFGALIEQTSYAAGWSVCAVSLLCAAVFVRLGRSMLIADLGRGRPPRSPAAR